MREELGLLPLPFLLLLLLQASLEGRKIPVEMAAEIIEKGGTS